MSEPFLPPINIEISLGELLDRLTILEIKMGKMTDEAKLANVRNEYERLEAVLYTGIFDDVDVQELYAELLTVNEDLWNVEDLLRIKERDGEFGDEFVQLARSVYITNDRRAAIKRQFNAMFMQDIVEEKEYVDYRQD